MKIIHKRYSFEEIGLFARKIVSVDTAINIVAGMLLLFAPKVVNHLLFDEQILPLWFYRIISIGFLFFAVWQLVFFIKPGGFTVRNLRFAAVLAWIPFLGLTIGLLSDIGDQLLILPKIFLWLANIYMLLLGGLYGWLAREIKSLVCKA